MKPRTASEIAEICGATLEGDGSIELVGPASLRDARSDQVSFLSNPQYRSELEGTRAGAVVLSHDVPVTRADLALLRCENPNLAFSAVIGAFQGDRLDVEPGVHPSAVVHPTAELDVEVRIGPNATVGPACRVGAGAVLHANVAVGARCTIGDGSVLYPGVVLYAGVSLGERCVVGGGTVLGSDGFGFEPTAEGWAKIPQCGSVEVGDDVEIGANCTVDRGRFTATRIGRGAKIDNLVHLAHNVEVGDHALLVAQVGISGSTRVGRRAILGGQAGAAGHLTIGDGARVGAGAGVTKSVPPGVDWTGFPARPRAQTSRGEAAVRRLPELLRAFRALEARVRELEARSPEEPQ